MAADPVRVQAVFLAAAEQPSGAARDSILDRECGGDVELRQQVEALLKAHDAPGSFLDRPALRSSPTENELPSADVDATQAPCTESVGTVIGNYKLLEQIGEGGFGTVFMAEQHHPVRRRVALKVIKPGMDTRQVIARFDVERQALAMMDHPNIAKVFDGGQTASGRPYFVMELVKGVPITDYCNQAHLSPRERLELFVTVCQAVQHAHQKGLIHRDLKPSNVLVAVPDGRPLVKIIDFGIAKATGGQLTDKTLFTGFAQMIGTPLYMSPEQAGQSLDIDTRSDIYSLGVLLYELLTGTTPFDRERFKKAAYDEIRRIICEEEPPKPSTRLSESNGSLPSISAQRHTEPAKLTKLMRGELDWIVMKALDKDRGRRYETANGFAADVQRYLDDETVQACPPSAGYRLRKFTRRNKAVLVTATVISIALLLGALISTWQAIRATSAERLADHRLQEETAARQEEEKQRQAAEQAGKRATDNLQLARDAVDQMLTEVGQTQLANVPQMEPLRRALLEKALQFYQKFLQGSPADPKIRLATGEAYQRIGKLYDQLGQYAEAEKTHHDSIRILERLVVEFPQEPKSEFALAETYRTLSRVLIHLRQWQKAEQAARQAIVWARKLTTEFPEAAAYRPLFSSSLVHLGTALSQLGRYREAEEALREALAVEERLAAEDPSNPRHRRGLADTCVSLAGVLAETGQHQEAEGNRRRNVQIMEELVSEFPDNPDYLHGLAHNRVVLGLALQGKKQFQDAEKEFQAAIALNTKATADYPKMTQYRSGLAESQFYMAGLFRATGRLREAEPFYRQAIENQMKLVAQAPGRPGYANDLRRTFGELSGLLLKMGKQQEAEMVNRQFLQFYEKLPAQGRLEKKKD